MLPLFWCLSIITDGRASSDWLLGPMLMCVRLGDVCVVLGSSLMFLVFFLLCVDRRKVYHIYFITTQIPMTQQLARINYIIESRIQAVTWNNIIFWQSTLKY